MNIDKDMLEDIVTYTAIGISLITWGHITTMLSLPEYTHLITGIWSVCSMIMCSLPWNYIKLLYTNMIQSKSQNNNPPMIIENTTNTNTNDLTNPTFNMEL